LAILWAKAKLEMISWEDYKLIKKNARVNVREITILDEGPGGFNHDMNAFNEQVKRSLRARGVPEEIVGLFNQGVTSYDVEDSAFSILLVKVCDIILPALRKLVAILRERAEQHTNTLIMGITHGQAAEVTTLALKLLNFVDMLERDIKRIETAREDMRYGRLAGAVGNYGHLGTELEKIVMAQLGLKAPRISTQILHRDRHATVANTIAQSGENLGHIAHNLWLMCQFPRLEAREPFKRGQRGSTQMPHKKNPIMLERMRGMAIMVRGFCFMIQSTVATFDERAIDQSCIERVAWPDLTSLVLYMCEKLSGIVEKIEFFPEQMARNIAFTRGVLGSGYIKDLLLSKGVSTMDFHSETLEIYKWVQSCAFEAWDSGEKHMREVVVELGILNHVSEEELEACFDNKRHLLHVGEVYERFDIA
jgi:adenylosuccinate lyase